MFTVFRDQRDQQTPKSTRPFPNHCSSRTRDTLVILRQKVTSKPNERPQVRIKQAGQRGYSGQRRQHIRRRQRVEADIPHAQRKRGGRGERRER